VTVAPGEVLFPATADSLLRRVRPGLSTTELIEGGE